MYDNLRYKNYNTKDCRFLACSEIRAASLSGQCTSSFRIMNTVNKNGRKNQLLRKNCAKNVAISNMNKYYDHCKGM